MALNILIVDDIKTNLVYLDALLEELNRADNINVIQALSAEEAIHKSNTYDIHLIISDVNMPDTDGFELARILKHDDKTKNIPIIFLTAEFKSEEFISNGYELGAIDYFTKPVEKYQFLNKINLYLDLLTKSKELEEYQKALNKSTIVSKADLNGIITFANEKMSEISGYSNDELLGKPHSILRSKNTPKEVFEDMWKTIKSKNTWFGILENRAKDGSSYYVKAAITPLLNNIGEIKEYIAIREDITELKRLQFEELSSSVNKALDINLDKVTNMFPIPTAIINEESITVSSNDMFNNCFKINEGKPIDNVFVKQEGYIYSDDIFDWKDIVSSSSDTEKVLINILGVNKEFCIKIKKIDDKNLYTVCFYPVSELV